MFKILSVWRGASFVVSNVGACALEITYMYTYDVVYTRDALGGVVLRVRSCLVYTVRRD